MSKNQFDGDKFNKEPFTEEENAAHREMRVKIEDAWPTIAGIDEVAKGGKVIARIVAVAAAIGVALAWLKNAGFF